MRIRRDIWTLDVWDPITLAYADAVRALRARPLRDPTSWEYQAAIHGRNGTEPPGVLWNECQHGGWYFLPWHRMYLYYFERIVRAEVTARGGPSDWALPYWNYEAPGRSALPPAFRARTMPDGSPNPLFVRQRSRQVNNGAQLPPNITDSSAAMALRRFTAPGLDPGFGGGRSGPSHLFGEPGMIELDPHGGVHTAVGGPTGWMSGFNTAALDPIFWLHHANLDRLWAEWLEQGDGRADPAEAAWLDQAFTLHDETGAEVKIRPSDVVDTGTQLSYAYDTTGAAQPPARPPARPAAQAAADDPELVGTSTEPVTLTGGPATVDVAVDRRTATTLATERAEPRAFLNLEDIEGDANPGTVYEVLVSVEGTPPHHVGNASFFGIEHSAQSRAAGDDPSHGLRRTYEVTGWVAGLRARNLTVDGTIRVHFRPIALIPAPGAEPAAEPVADVTPVRVGRVSLFYQ